MMLLGRKIFQKYGWRKVRNKKLALFIPQILIFEGGKSCRGDSLIYRNSWRITLRFVYRSVNSLAGQFEEAMFANGEQCCVTAAP